ncbi:MAG: radical SAM family heme chaperone HemW [Deltaproteobacteria bacterium]|nr:radical SAM family heme chaperone HemW [Deltaproteobacteria bacterium]
MVSEKEGFSLYVHIPYCVSKCPYCDFNSHVVPKIPEDEYNGALIQEMACYAQREDWRGRKLKSIFFGGGTPSTFSPASIGKILERSVSLFTFDRDVEITLEANPGTVDGAHFSGYRSCGVNRISIGAQTFQSRLLKFLGRVHTADESREALKTVHQAGFENFSVDLIYAIPGQSLADLKADLEEALSFHPPHLSAYNLTIEEGTPFHREYRQGKIRNLPEEEEIAMAELIGETLSRTGLERYEISNYARPGWHSRHNVNYWRSGDYLGIGAGAHSYKQQQDNGALGCRWQNEKSPATYMERVLKSGQAVVEREQSDPAKAVAEFMFLGLRMTRGISAQEFSRRFGKKPAEFYPQIRDWLEGGLMEQKDERLRLTRRGLLVANSIFVDFV